MFDKLKKHIEEKNKKYLKYDLIIFIKSHDISNKFTKDDIRINKDYMFVGYENKDQTKVKDVLTGNIYTYNFNKDGMRHVSVNTIYDYIPVKLCISSFEGDVSYSFEPLGTCAKKMEIDTFTSSALNTFAFANSNELVKTSTIDKMVKFLNKEIDNNIKREVKVNERINARRVNSGLSDKEREF